MQAEFEALPGVVHVTAGYTRGSVKNPPCAQVGSGKTGRVEAIEVAYDPAKVTDERLVDTDWENVDPLNPAGQFCDRGEEYRSVILVRDDGERQVAEASKARVEERLHAKVATRVLAASPFHPAEEYHQDSARKNPYRDGLHRKGCRRDELLKQIWGVTPLDEPEKAKP